MSLCAIMLCGAAGSGKTTVAAVLRRHIPNITELTFAAPLKTICLRAGRLLLPPDVGASLTADHFHDPVLKATPLEVEVDGHERGRNALTPRAIMQVLGTDILRGVLGPDVFIGPVLAGAARAAAAKQHIVVSDVRFANEMGTAPALAALGFRVVRLRIVRKEASVDSAHASEAEASSLPVDAVVANNGTMEELEAAVLAAIAQTSPHP
jgi:hypothetical protein